MNTPADAPQWMQRRVRRARPLLGTVVMLQVEASADDATAPADLAALHAACSAAFDAIAHIHRVMSAHRPDSDLGLLARATPGATLTLDPHTINVLRAARRWQRASGGAFDPVLAAQTLAAAGLRPAFDRSLATTFGDLSGLTIEGANSVVVAAPLRLDLGGIAKGYAVDVAIEVLRRHGVTSALVNAGGDMRATGLRRWPIELRRRLSPPAAHARRAVCPPHPPRHLEAAALASSETGVAACEFIDSLRRSRTRRTREPRRVSVAAPDCMSADALTKWALQADAASPRLRRALREAGASLWIG